MTEQQFDEITRAKHYNMHPSGIECIQVVRHFNFNLGNVIKYLWRAGLKGTELPIKDLKKAAFYLNDEIQKREKETTFVGEVIEYRDPAKCGKVKIVYDKIVVSPDGSLIMSVPPVNPKSADGDNSTLNGGCL